jgi:hypothetical protein
VNRASWIFAECAGKHLYDVATMLEATPCLYTSACVFSMGNYRGRWFLSAETRRNAHDFYSDFRAESLGRIDGARIGSEVSNAASDALRAWQVLHFFSVAL